MNRIINAIKMAKSNGKKVYIRGFSDFGFGLSIWLDKMNIAVDGYYDVDDGKVGRDDHKGRKCFASNLANEESFVLCVVQNEKAKRAITEELTAKNVEHTFISLKEMNEILRDVDDETFLKEYYLMFLGKPLNLENPKTLCEKIQWLKMYDRNPLYTKLADKYEVRKYVAETIGEKYLVPNFGVWNSFDEIDFDTLPKQFILKCTNNSGYFYVVKDKENFDKKAARKILEEGLQFNYFYQSREWVYKDIQPRIIADAYIDTLGQPDSIEYKITCFNGKFAFLTFCKGKAHASYEERTNDHYDINFEKQYGYVNYKNTDIAWEKPDQWDEFIEISEKLAQNIPYVRADFYIHNDKIYFGELTFYTWAGFMKFEPEEWDRKLGDMLVLPDKHS